MSYDFDQYIIVSYPNAPNQTELVPYKGTISKESALIRVARHYIRVCMHSSINNAFVSRVDTIDRAVPPADSPCPSTVYYLVPRAEHPNEIMDLYSVFCAQPSSSWAWIYGAGAQVTKSIVCSFQICSINRAGRI